ncbi:leucyl aminopeptidase [Jonesia denitrificans]|uniref:Probable cytosol aminopeptidase n=1 Tax=Jonesia denitrificans (strain ATCC 14870 / DSM 20603 / BCRC 15368 / CIP 55.134 / JCM 11481 / NBRC 15587 / NCTC 10816 / Prevot 55134) TaxID=471856 RepID=C7R4U6_JONDD|nr:leucyl aminopeptidase [Jonesia denitrificans]ACV09116.1 Leucyl aminopeptidase [Jonesia denitrificans DSM 20603]ASE09601.1 leucyl aminopeptidase [Jonesia denitrificans]QXB44142.1 leucyl aminopeptidase [Jonesia denitrificans]SQH21315.1 Cytosol aminopeptidase [Jonesia denitrificans]
MAEITLTTKDLSAVSTDVLVLGVDTIDDTPTIVGPTTFDTATLGDINLRALGASAKADSVVRIPAPRGFAARTLAFVGLGDAPYGREEQLRRAAGSATRQITGVDSLVVALPTTEESEVIAVAEGALFGSYTYTVYRSEQPGTTVPASRVEIATPLARQAVVKKALPKVKAVAQAVHRTRDLVNMPPNDLFPAAFADAAKSAVKGTGVKVQVLDDKALAAGGYGGILAVGQGSSRGPRLVKLSWTPAKAGKKVALVGKGITFDTGGISLKPAAGMEAMKSDMAGAAAVLSTVVAAAQLSLPVSVTAYLCLAENMPSGSASRPSDVITMRGGKTVEILNTDAEGRLVMADGLVSATEDNPDLIVDIATLTGAQMIALGNRVAAVMGTDAAVEEVLAAGTDSGEALWPMPLPAELRPSLDSHVADIANMGQRYGGMLVAGHFLKEFTGDRPWAHIDIAGPSFNEQSPHGYTSKGGTGFGVRTLLALLEDYSR